MAHSPSEKVTYFAQTDSRNKRVPFGIKAKDRSRHVYVIGKTGMGKSTLLENMAIQDINNGEGMAFIDPHGKTAELLLDYVPRNRVKDVLYFAPFDLDYPVSFNVMEDVGYEKRHLVANGLMSAFKKIWVDAWSARMEYILNNVLLSLLEYPDSTLIGVNRMLIDKEYRKRVVENVTDPSVKSFWLDEFAKYGEKYMQEAGAAIQNKIGQFISNPVIRNIIGQPKSTFDIRKIMDEKKILIINLSKGRVGEANANLLGSMLITKIYLAAMSRADVSPSVLSKLPEFYMYVDEFQSFANESFADILSEARKYKLALTIAHQYIEQMSEEVRAAVFGNVGTMISFRVGSYDADVLEKEFAPQFVAEDIVNLGMFQMYLKLMIDSVSSSPSSGTGLPPIARPTVMFREDIINNSRSQFAKSRGEVEDQIKLWHQPVSTLSSGQRQDSAQYDVRNDGRQTPRAEGRYEKRPEGGRSEGRPPQGKYENIRREDSRPREDARGTSSTPQVQRGEMGQKTEQFRNHGDAEKELRKVISLNYLKNSEADEEAKKRREEERKRRDKNASEQNVSALRDALASVLKDAGIGVTEKNQNSKPDVVTINIREDRGSGREVSEDVSKKTLENEKSGLKHEIKHEIKQEIKPEIHQDVQQEVKREVKHEVKQEMEREAKSEARQEAADRIKSEQHAERAPKPETKPGQNGEQKASSEKKNTREVPEDVLRRVLDVTP